MREDFKNLFCYSNFPLAKVRNSSKFVLNLGTPPPPQMLASSALGFVLWGSAAS